MGRRNHWLARVVDADLVRSQKSLSVFLPFFLLILLLVVSGAWVAEARVILWALMAAIALPWYAFVGWRAWRLTQAALWRGDRNYDTIGKYRLPPEYAVTESATAARKRRWKQERRARKNRD